MRILFVTHTGTWSGAESALLNLIEKVRAEHEVAVACPSGGTVAARMDRAGIRRFTMPAFEASFRLDPVTTPLGAAGYVAAVVGLALAARRFRPDVVHAATVRAGLIAALAIRRGQPPVVVHVHDHLPASSLGRVVRRVIASRSHAVVAVSAFTAHCFDEGLRQPIAVPIYNGIDHLRFDPEQVKPARLRDELGLSADALLLGVVAQITPWKGQDTAIQALAELRRMGHDAHLVIVGRVVFTGRHVAHDNRAFLAELKRLTAELELSGAVHFLGFREDTPALLSALDLLLVPSWGEPFALVVLESMAMHTPVVVTDVGGSAELVQSDDVGRTAPPRAPERWAQAIDELAGDRPGLVALGQRAAGIASRHRDDRHAREMIGIYEWVSGAGARPRGRSSTSALPPMNHRARPPKP